MDLPQSRAKGPQLWLTQDLGKAGPGGVVPGGASGLRWEGEG